VGALSAAIFEDWHGSRLRLRRPLGTGPASLPARMCAYPQTVETLGTSHTRGISGL
jgi:hypothetical protein